MERAEVFIANTVKCRPPNNRDPHPNEIESCNEYLRSQVELIEPTVICTLGNFATKLLRADTTGISRLHGQAEIRVIGTRAIRLFPLYHPAAALYTPSTLEGPAADFHRIPELLALGAPEQSEPDEPVPEPVPEDPASARPPRRFSWICSSRSHRFRDPLPEPGLTGGPGWLGVAVGPVVVRWTLGCASVNGGYRVEGRGVARVPSAPANVPRGIR